VILVLCALPSSGCVVLGLDRFYDELSIAFDERLLGTWRSTDDDVTVTVERSDWRAYRVKYEQTIEQGTLTAYLFKSGEQLFLDLTPARGQDFGAFVLPMHAVLRVGIEADRITVSPLSYDWFDSGLRRGTLEAGLGAARAERDQILLSAGRLTLESWLASLAADAPTFGPPVVFEREKRMR
jgi:hypothetical protein